MVHPLLDDSNPFESMELESLRHLDLFPFEIGWHMWPEKYATKMGTIAGPCIPLSFVQKENALAGQARSAVALFRETNSSEQNV